MFNSVKSIKVSVKEDNKHKPLDVRTNLCSYHIFKIYRIVETLKSLYIYLITRI